MTRHDRTCSLGRPVAAYLLGALPDDERSGFEAHLAGCNVCADEVATLRVAADALPSLAGAAHGRRPSCKRPDHGAS